MTHGDDTTAPKDEQPPVAPEHRFRQSQSGSVAPPTQGEAGAEGTGNGSLEKRRQDASRSDGLLVGNDSSLGAVEEQQLLNEIQISLQNDWSGPLPPPAALQQYEMVLAGAADRILCMAETGATGTSKREDKLAEAEIERAKQGQAIAFTLTLLSFIASIVFFLFKQSIPGMAFISFPVLMMIKAFLGR
ncbi:putative membrane protein [Actinomadura luteofluorescens]|uniref:Putative membrane protein n=1 Tax=Actinomadura luteofluorescens TaxID=46163 RepID=A0A7Y9JKL2_9ACTN|nr:DUF2335 domain-containing protein [Actinomadura luteofluorescens]NYD51758.1 putative membrane protein [Actinomadura luteofluorescens]